MSLTKISFAAAAASLATAGYMYYELGRVKEDLAATVIANDIAKLYVRAHELGEKAEDFCGIQPLKMLNNYKDYTQSWVESWGERHTRGKVSLQETFNMLDMLDANKVTLVGEFTGTEVQFFDSPTHGKVLSVDLGMLDKRVVHDFIMDLGKKGFSMSGKTVGLNYDSYSEERYHIAEGAIGETDGVRQQGKYTLPAKLDKGFCR